MSRAFAIDFEVLGSFFKAYSLANKFSSPEFLVLLKKVHKQYLGFLTLLAEIEHQAKSNAQWNRVRFRRTFNYVLESASDIGLACFCFSHGAIKPSRIMARSAIETLIKGITAAENPSVISTKSVFNVLDEAKKVHFFSGQPQKRLVEQLESSYGGLCEDVHTARLANMAHVSALDTFPAFSLGTSIPTAELIAEVTKRLLSIACLFYSEQFHAMHFENKDIVVACLSKPIKRSLNQLE